MSHRTRGRMLNKDISDSSKYASLSPEAAVLFTMIIPHLNSHGKLNGGVGFIKDEVCPKIKYLTIHNLSTLLAEISEKTNIKWFKNDERCWIHSLNFLSQHQNLKPDRLGQDLLPTYSGPTPEYSSLTPPEVEVEVEVEDQGKSGVTQDQVQSSESPEEQEKLKRQISLKIKSMERTIGKGLSGSLLNCLAAKKASMEDVNQVLAQLIKYEIYKKPYALRILDELKQQRNAQDNRTAAEDRDNGNNIAGLLKELSKHYQEE